ncbi:PTS system, ascorbate-specific IIA component [Methylophilaceae bacterium]|nr:PTS system, ascorbate-specific IIA component [Methylophilaceae bacterium]
MIGILIIAHGTLGESLIHCASHVMGTRPPLLKQLNVGTHDDPMALLPQAQQLIEELDQGDGVLILSDIYGATPCNVVTKLLVAGRIEGVAGVNLPMLVRTLTYRNGDLRTLIGKALSGGREGVIHFTELD